jgi:hypothetical protein
LHNFSISTTFVLVASPSEIINYHYTLMTVEHMDSFGINSTKSCGVYLDIQMILNQKNLNKKVVDLVEYYNFNIKFVFIGYRIRKLWSFLAAYYYRFKKPTVMTQHQSRLVLSLSVIVKNQQWCAERHYYCWFLKDR